MPCPMELHRACSQPKGQNHLSLCRSFNHTRVSQAEVLVFAGSSMSGGTWLGFYGKCIIISIIIDFLSLDFCNENLFSCLSIYPEYINFKSRGENSFLLRFLTQSLEITGKTLGLSPTQDGHR